MLPPCYEQPHSTHTETQGGHNVRNTKLPPVFILSLEHFLGSRHRHGSDGSSRRPSPYQNSFALSPSCASISLQIVK